MRGLPDVGIRALRGGSGGWRARVMEGYDLDRNGSEACREGDSHGDRRCLSHDAVGPERLALWQDRLVKGAAIRVMVTALPLEVRGAGVGVVSGPVEERGISEGQAEDADQEEAGAEERAESLTRAGHSAECARAARSRQGWERAALLELGCNAGVTSRANAPSLATRHPLRTHWPRT